MGVFTDELNKLKAKMVSAPVPKLGQTTPFVPAPSTSIPKKVPPMEFKVGAGLTPEQTKVAEETVRKVDPVAIKQPYSFKESLALFRSNIASQTQKDFNPTYKPSPEENKIAIAGLFNPTIGATSGLIKGFTQKATPELLEWLAKTKSPQVIESEIIKLGVAPDVAKSYAPKLAATKNVDEVKNVLFNETGIVPSKNPISGETPAQALARSEAYAAQQHLPKVQLSEEGIPMARKNVPFMPRTNQPPSQLPSLIDITTGAGRSREIQASQYLEEKTPQQIPPTDLNSDVSLLDTIAKEPTPVKDKVNIIDYIRTPDRVLKKIGLEEEGKFLRTQQDKFLKELPKNIDRITEWSKRASKEGSEDIFRYLDGEAMDLKPQDKEVALEIKTWLSEWADRLGLPKDNRIAHYITHIFDQELIKKEFPEELAKLIDNRLPGEVYDPFLEKRLGALGYKKDVWAALDAYVKRATRKVHMDPALEKIKDASGKLEKSQHDFVKSYISNINMRPGKVDTLIDNGIKQLIGYRLGQRPLLTITRFLRQMTYRAFLGLNPASALKNISQGINTYSKLGEKYTTIGYTKLFSKGSKAELEAEGILNAGFIEDRALSSTKKVIENFDKGLFFFFQTAEHINRGAAYFGAKSQGLAKGMTEREAIDYAKKIVRDTQFAFGKIDTPLILSSDLGKTIGQFQSFTTKQIEFLMEMSKKAMKGDEKAKNFVGLLRYAIAGTIFVSTIGEAFNMKITDLIPTVRLGTPPSLKIPVEVGKAVLNVPDKYGKERDLEQKAKDVGKTLWGIIPGGTQLKKTLEGYEAMKEGAAKDAAGRTQFDVGGTPLKDAQALIFGKYSGQGAKDYYEDDTTYAEATLKKIMASPTGDEDFIKIIQENPALAENVTKAFEDQALGLTKDEKKIRNMGVATKQRAKEVAKIINKLDNKETKTALIIDYIEKKIITDDVADQLIEFLK